MLAAMKSAAAARPPGKGMHIFLGFFPISRSAVRELAQCFPAISTGVHIDPIEAHELFRLPSISSGSGCEKKSYIILHEKKVSASTIV